jgi:hypothetical protein
MEYYVVIMPDITNQEIFESLQESMRISGEQFRAIDKRFDAVDSRMYNLEHQAESSIK